MKKLLFLSLSILLFSCGPSNEEITNLETDIKKYNTESKAYCSCVENTPLNCEGMYDNINNMYNDITMEIARIQQENGSWDYASYNEMISPTHTAVIKWYGAEYDAKEAAKEE